jgi:hypothetical protein
MKMKDRSALVPNVKVFLHFCVFGNFLSEWKKIKMNNIEFQ